MPPEEYERNYYAETNGPPKDAAVNQTAAGNPGAFSSHAHSRPFLPTAHGQFDWPVTNQNTHLKGTTLNIEITTLASTGEAIGAYSPAVKAAGLIFTSGQVGVDPATNEIPGSFRHEVELAVDSLVAVLHAAGSDLAHVVRMECLLSDIGDFAVMNEVYGERFAAPFPARFTHGTALAAGYRIELVATAVSA